MVEQDRMKERLDRELTLITAEELALSLVPLLEAVNRVGGIAKAVGILRRMAESEREDEE